MGRTRSIPNEGPTELHIAPPRKKKLNFNTQKIPGIKISLPKKYKE